MPPVFQKELYLKYTELYIALLSLFIPSVEELHREFLRAGSDVMQTFTFYASEDKLENRGNVAGDQIGVFSCINSLHVKF